MNRLLCLSVAFSVPGLAQPTIKQLQNNYSYILPGLPNYGIAEGSIFIITGNGQANGPTGLQTSYPLPVMLLGASVSVTVNGVTTVPILYYVLPTQIAAILPSATPVGTGTITVTNNGSRSHSGGAERFRNFDLLWIRKRVRRGIRRQLPVHGAAVSRIDELGEPGRGAHTVGSGIRPDPGNPDETVPQKLNNLMGSLPIEVDIGGIASTILYAGRSIYPGLDQINVYGRTCSDPNIPYTASQLQTLTAQKTVNVGVIGIGRTNAGGKITNGVNSYFES